MKGEGTIRLGRYELFEEIASGGMATMFLGRITGVGGFARAVAIKRLHARYAKDPELRMSLVDEARLASRVRHHNVVAAVDVIDADGEVCLVAEYVHGESLEELLRTVREEGLGIDPRIACAIVAGMLRGLHAAHEAKDENGQPLELVHRDVSPHNVLVDVNGVPRVVDFGIAKAVGRLLETRDGAVKGKLAYMAPEQLRRRPVSRRTDIHAAGVVLWESLTGQRLFDADNEAAVVAEVLRGNIPPPSAVVSSLPTALDSIVARATARDPAQRFASAAEMAMAIEEAVPIAAPSELGTWVRTVASESIAARSALLEALERLPKNEDDVQSDAGGSPGGLELVARLAPRDGRARSFSIAAGVLAAGVAALALVGRPDSPSAVAEQRANPTPAAADVSPDASDDEPLDTASPLAESAVDPTLVPGAALSRPRGTATKRAPRKKSEKSVKTDCDPPSYVDAQGHLRYKSGCLK